MKSTALMCNSIFTQYGFGRICYISWFCSLCILLYRRHWFERQQVVQVVRPCQGQPLPFALSKLNTKYLKVSLLLSNIICSRNCTKRPVLIISQINQTSAKNKMLLRKSDRMQYYHKHMLIAPGFIMHILLRLVQ